MLLHDLVETRFARLPALLAAAASGRYKEGAHNTGIYALPGSQRVDILDVVTQYGFGEIARIAAAQAVQEQEKFKGSPVLLGPLTMDACIDMWRATKYFLNTAHDFQKIDLREMKKTNPLAKDYRIDARCFPDEKPTIVAGISKQEFDVNIYGKLDEKTRFSMSILSSGMCDEIELELGMHPNYLYFSTHTKTPTEEKYWQNDKLNLWNIQLNGPANNPIIRDVLTLGTAIKDYCIHQCKQR